jgi:hypothetical protein
MTDEHPKQKTVWPRSAIFTLGHSTLPIERFIALLRTYGIERLLDIRTVPCSRHNPQFNDSALERSLAAEHNDYVHMAGLGGLRQPRRDSPNGDWHAHHLPAWARGNAVNSRMSTCSGCSRGFCFQLG